MVCNNFLKQNTEPEETHKHTVTLINTHISIQWNHIDCERRKMIENQNPLSI